MFTHEEIWVALDRLAAANNYSTSGLAKKAGLDPTTFNKSKRITADGKPRWPSTESIAKSLAATNATLMDLIGFIEGESAPSSQKTARSVPHFECTHTQLKRLNQKHLSTLTNVPEGSFAVSLSTPQWTPNYQNGATLIMTPQEKYHEKDIIFIETTGHEFFIMSVEKDERSALTLRAIIINEPDRRIDKADIKQSAKILWASQ